MPVTWLFIALLHFTAAHGQVMPYYESAVGTSGAELKSALHNIIKNHQTYPYTSSSTDVWDILKVTDRDPSNPANVILIYSGTSVNAAQEYNNGNGWNREHVWPQSRGNLGTSQGAGTDVHHLRPCNINVNNTRANRFFANCTNCTSVNINGNPTGSFIDSNTGTFEVRDAEKGDVARMIFYMAVRYEGSGNEPDLELTNTILADNNPSPFMGVLSDMLQWNNTDQPDAFELNRNEVIYSYQNNRNPFVDYPELAEHIWGSLTEIPWFGAPSSSAETSGRKEIYLYPNPTQGYLSATETFDSITIFDTSGRQLLQQNSSDNLDVSHLPAGIYLARVYQSGSHYFQKIVKY